MSLLPHIFDDVHPSCNRPGCHRSPLSLDWWFKPTDYPALRSALGSPATILKQHFPDFSKLEHGAKMGKDGFQVCVDVQHFLPKEIEVKTENNTVIVHAKHEEKEDDHGYISREFTRRYTLPQEFKIEDVTSTLSSDGILTITAPSPTPAVEGKVHHIPIQQTGPAHLNVASNEEVKDEEK
uniref:Small heat shock protein Hsp20.3 n=1 Tax=Sitodiplosis mosellana TaxID=263140 RepID=A0A5J6DCJ1_9DIPT|nr:small heat shock protein Hsp20.3 [Sitodiplosis mosellana]